MGDLWGISTLIFRQPIGPSMDHAMTWSVVGKSVVDFTHDRPSSTMTYLMPQPVVTWNALWRR